MKNEIIAIVPARSGSKGVTNKNILKIGSKTLIEIAILQARKISKINKVIISSDSQKYINYGLKAGGISLGKRPHNLSGDDAKTLDVLKYILKEIPEVEIIVLLQPTSPIRSVVDIEKALQICINQKKCVISIAEIEEPNPYKLQNLDSNNIISPLLKDEIFNSETPRQLLPKAYRLTGGFYCLNVKEILKYNTVIPPGSIGFTCEMYPNIDTQEDVDYINWLLDRKKDLPNDFLEILSMPNI